jgi:hypothetical protein
MTQLEDLIRQMDPWVARVLLDVGAALSLSGLIVEMLRLGFD